MVRTIEIKTDEGWMPVEGWDCGAGALVVTRALCGATGRPTRGMFVVTHEATGLRALPLATPVRAHAEQLARELAGLLDWSAITAAEADAAPGPAAAERKALHDRLLRDTDREWYARAWDPPEGAEIERDGGRWRFRADGGPWRVHGFYCDACDAIDLVRARDATWEEVGVAWDPTVRERSGADDADGLAGPVEADARASVGRARGC